MDLPCLGFKFLKGGRTGPFDLNNFSNEKWTCPCLPIHSLNGDKDWPI